jgi:hypothetical protein
MVNVPSCASLAATVARWQAGLEHRNATPFAISWIIFLEKLSRTSHPQHTISYHGVIDLSRPSSETPSHIQRQVGQSEARVRVR